MNADDLLPAAIRRDYTTVREYAELAATVCPLELIARGYQRHVPHKTIPTMLGWGRDRWCDFDRLPRTLRDMVNDERVSDPKAVLDETVAFWTTMTIAAERAMDRIVGYENSIHAVNGLPSWLKGKATPEILLIRQFRQARIDHQAALAEAARLARAARDQAAKKQNQRSRRWVRATSMVSYRVEGHKLSEVEIIDPRGLAPHVMRRLLDEQRIKPFKGFEARHWTRPAGFRDIDKAAEAAALDNTPPLKVHPVHYRRGKNDRID